MPARISSSSPSATARTGERPDTIADFKHSQLDKIDLHLIDANDRHWQAIRSSTSCNGAAFTPGRTACVRRGEPSIIEATLTATADADFAINLTHVNHLVKGDFIL